jgi:hypothetical protein
VKQEYIDCLHAVLAARGHRARFGNDVHRHTAEFTQALPVIANNLRSFGKGERVLFLLD